MSDEPNKKEELDSAAERMLADHSDLKTQTDEHRDALEKMRAQLKAIEDRVAVAHAVSKQDDRQKPVSMMRMAQACIRTKMGDRDPWQHAEYEREVVAEHASTRTSMAAGKDSLGGYWVPEEYLPQEFVDLMRAKVVVYGMGARQLTGLTGSPVDIPRKTGNSTAYWVAEGAAITESNLTAGSINMEPHACAALVKLSNRLIMLGNPSVEAMVQEDMATSLALKIEYAAIRGDGASGSPLGVAAPSR